MAKRKIIDLSTAEQNYRDAFKSGDSINILRAKQELDIARQQTADNETRSISELTDLYNESMRNNNMALVMKYYNAIQSIRCKSGNIQSEDAIISDVIKDVNNEFNFD